MQESLHSNTYFQKHYIVPKVLKLHASASFNGKSMKSYFHFTQSGSKSEECLNLKAFSFIISQCPICLHCSNTPAKQSTSQKTGGLCTKNSCFNTLAVAFFILERSATPKPSLKGTTNISYERPLDKLMLDPSTEKSIDFKQS